MLRALLILIPVALAIYCLVDIVQSPPDRVRTMPRWAWALVIVAIPLLGAVGWFLAGRPVSHAPYRGSAALGAPPEGEQRRVTAPDDDPEFLNKLKQQQLSRENERLRKWQADLERRERELGDDGEKKSSDGQSDQQ